MAQYKLASRDILSPGFRDAREGGREGEREGRSRFSINLPEMSRKGKERKDAPVYWLAGWQVA